MNEMYNMSIVMHDVGVAALVIAIVVNMSMLYRAKERKAYTRKMRIFMPMTVMALAAVMFTGTVMMAAKHLAFDLPNLVMILASIVLIVLESRRYRRLRRLDRTRVEALSEYRAQTFRLMVAELLIIFVISLGMYLL